MDPSPFHERDLDDDAEEFIVGWAREFPRRDPVSLVVHVDQLPPHGDAQRLLETAVHHYFAYRAKLNRLEFRHLLKQGRTSLIIGLAFLAACMLTSPAAASSRRNTTDHPSGRADHRRLGRYVASYGNLPLRMVAAPAQRSSL